MLLYFASLPVIRARQQWSLAMPNAANISFNFYYFLVVTMLLYIPCELSYPPHTLTTPLYTPCSVPTAVWSHDQSTEKDHWRSYLLRKEKKLKN